MTVDSALITLLASAPPMDGPEEVLIPIVAIIGGISIPIVAIIMTYRKQKLQARLIERAIEQGLTIEEIDELLARQGFMDSDSRSEKTPSRTSRQEVPFRKGLILFAVGAAFFLAENPDLVGVEGGWGFGPQGILGGTGNFVAYLLMGLGGAFVASDLLGIFFGPDNDDK